MLLAGVGRILLQHHRTGDTGIRSFTARLGSRQWWANRIIEAGGIVVGVAAPAAHLAGLDPLPVLDWTGLRYTGVAIAVIGIIATSVAQLAMGGSWRIGVDPAERTLWSPPARSPSSATRSSPPQRPPHRLGPAVPNPGRRRRPRPVLHRRRTTGPDRRGAYLRAVHGQAYEPMPPGWAASCPESADSKPAPAADRSLGSGLGPPSISGATTVVPSFGVDAQERDAEGLHLECTPRSSLWSWQSTRVPPPPA